MSRDWETAYYEQQALHTEATGILARERDTARAQLAASQEALRTLEAVVTKRNRYRDRQRHTDVNDALVNARTVLAKEIR